MDLGIPPTTIAMACIATLSALFFSVAFLIDWIRNWRHVKVYWAYGIGAGLGTLAFGILGAVAGAAEAASRVWSELPPPGWEGSATPSGPEVLILLIVGLLLILLVLVICVIAVSRLAGVTMLGMHYAASLGHPSFPLLQRLRRARPPAAADRAWPAVAGAAVVGRRPRYDYALSTLGVAVAAVGYSVALFHLTSPRLSQVLAGLPGYTPERADAFTLQVLVTLLAAAFSEEIVFRLGMQNFLARYLNCSGSRYWIPIALTTLVWTLAHAGAMEPGWVKLAQILPIGLLLGWLYRRHGVESCMLAHALFNVGLTPLTSFLITG